MKSEFPRITILSSAIGLGIYIPALLINYQLRKQGLDSEVMVLEDYYTPLSKNKFKKHQQAYHDNFSLALMAHRMTRDVQDNLDTKIINIILENWQDENRLHFITWSGFWLPIIDQYRKRVSPQKLKLDLCRIDAEISASFKIYPHHKDDSEIWLWNWEQKKLIYEIPVTDRPSIPYHERGNRLVIHGGGWSLGTYQSKIPELERKGILLDIIVHELLEANHKKDGNRYFMVDPDWNPWHKNQNNQHEFPPFAEIMDLEQLEFKNREEYHELYDVISQSKAIVSKPGGGTLIDSLASATPIILLEAYGYAEQRNAEIWEYLGYGISYQKWQEMDYNFDILHQLHQNLLNRSKNTINYPQEYAKKIIKNLKVG